jgi:hypothetical protein
VIDRDPLVLDEFHVDHLHRVLRDFYLVHSDEMKNHRAPVNLRDVDLNSVLMVVMKVYLNQDVLDAQKNRLMNQVVMIRRDEGRPLDGRPELFGRSEFPRRSSMCLFSYLY